MEIRLARSAGFCFGVRRAVDAVYALLDQGKKVVTLGPIIHNPQVVEALGRRGVGIVQAPEETPPGAVLVIRSHGVARAVHERLREQGTAVYDATCPFVHKIHQIVAQQSAAGGTVLIAGDAQHPEVIGIKGYCSGECVVFSSEEELETWVKKRKNPPDFSPVMVAQTTFRLKTWEKCVEIIKKHYTNARIFDTICNATARRQQEAVALAQNCELLVIVGGRASSNTAKLQEVCQPFCPTLLIETADELSRASFDGIRVAGLTAGASTPADIIKEVFSTMSEIVNNNNNTEPKEAAVPVADAVPVPEEAPVAKSFDEMSFEEALEASLQSLNTDERVKGIVVGIAPNEVQVEVAGRKQAGYIPADELSADPSVSPADIVKIGDELDLLIMRTNDQEGTIMLSKKRVDAQKGWLKVVEAEKTGEVLDGTVTDVIKGGVLAVTNGVRVFIPASQASLHRMEDLSPLLKQPVRFKIIEINPHRRRAVGSIRMVAKDERKEKEDAFWAQAEVGQTYTGVVKSLTSYGAFVDLGGVDGMVHISELSWGRIKHPSAVVNVGDTVEVYIRDLDMEKRKISLGYRKEKDNPWEIFKANYPIGSTVKTKIVGMTAFGAFAQILPGIDGLIHISQIADHHVEKPQDELKVGQDVTVKITDVDYDKHRISLSIREAMKDEPASETVSLEKAASEAAVEEPDAGSAAE